jgi:hypothetical protein
MAGTNELCGGAKGKNEPRVNPFNLEDEVIQPLDAHGSILATQVAVW